MSYKLEEKLKIIVVDDHEFFRRGLVFVLNKMKFVEVVAEAAAVEAEAAAAAAAAVTEEAQEVLQLQV